MIRTTMAARSTMLNCQCVTAGRVSRVSRETRSSGGCWPGTTRSLPVVAFDNDRLLTSEPAGNL